MSFLQLCFSLNAQIRTINSQRVLVFLFAEKGERKTDTNNIDTEKEMLLTKGEIGKGGKEKKNKGERGEKKLERGDSWLMCVCVRERERKRDRERQRDTDRDR